MLSVEILLKLPYSLNSWLILVDYINNCNNPNELVFEKIINDYYNDCPLKEMARILSIAQEYVSSEEVTNLFNLYLKLSTQ